ncbi:MAG: hypothetical protein ACEPOV_10200 [Hyphomicrobiales bacterium]
MKKSSTLSDHAFRSFVNDDDSHSIDNIPESILAFAENNGPSQEVINNIMNYSKSLSILKSEDAGNFDLILN